MRLYPRPLRSTLSLLSLVAAACHTSDPMAPPPLRSDSFRVDAYSADHSVRVECRFGLTEEFGVAVRSSADLEVSNLHLEMSLTGPESGFRVIQQSSEYNGSMTVDALDNDVPV